MNDNDTREVDITALKERLALIFYVVMVLSALVALIFYVSGMSYKVENLASQGEEVNRRVEG